MIETHAHLYDEQFERDIETIINDARAIGVTKAYLPNCDSSTIEPMMELVKRYPDFCIPMMGVHPCYIKEDFEKELAFAYKWLQQASFAAVGEIGLDYHWDLEHVAQQKIAFERQIDWALEFNLPIVIHSRNATPDCIAIVKARQHGQLRGIFHCYGDDLATAQQIIDLGFLMGIGGVLTFKNSGLAETLQGIGLEHLVLETDAPYLAPVPKRGKRNEPAYLAYIADKLAEVKQVTKEEVIRVTTANAAKIFG